MADLALNDSLINEYLKYKFQDDYNTDKIRKLFKYIQPFSIRESYSLISDPSMASQLISDPLIELIEDCSDEELVQNSLLKLMIVDSFSSKEYRILNINDSLEKLIPKYVGTYSNNMGKDKAQKHIKALLSDAKWIRITDGYMSSRGEWSTNKSIIIDIVPCIDLDLTIIGGDKESGNFTLSSFQKSELESLCSTWNIKTQKIPKNIHDRYIETDSFKILLSSGICHLSSTSNKDFTYVIEIK